MAQHDSLDLPALVAQGLRYRRAARNRLLRMTLILLILMLPTVALTYNIIVPTTQIYRLDTSGEWSSFNLPLGDVTARTVDFVLDDTGALWSLDGNGITLNRYRNGRWEEFPSYMTGIHLRDYAHITTDGDQLWGVSGGDVFHYDGVGWEVFENVLPTDTPLAIASGQYGVFVIDEAGNLSRFWQGTWKHAPIANALPGIAPEAGFYEDVYTPVPVFAQAPGGPLWLTYVGLWQFDGDGWKHVGRESSWEQADYWLAAATGEAIWYLDGYGAQRLNVSDGEVERFLPEAIGLKRYNYIWGGALQGDRFWVGGGDRLYVYENGAWRMVTTLPGGVDADPTQLIPGPDGSILLTMYNHGTTVTSVDNPDGVIVGSTLALLAPLLLIAADFFLRYLPDFRQNRRRWADMYAQATPLPEFDSEAEVRNPWNVRRFILSYFAQIVLMLIAMTGILFTLSSLIGTTQIPLVFALSAGLGYIMARLLINGYLLQISDTNTRTNIRLLLQGDYDYLLERNGYAPDNTAAQAAKHGNPIWQIYGLLLAKRDAEALPVLRETLRKLRGGQLQNNAMLVANIGYCMMHMERYDEALPYFEATTRFAPDVMTGYVALAHYYLNTESDPGRALTMIEASTVFDERYLIDNALTAYGRLSRQMTHALVLAFNVRRDEALALAARTASDRALKWPVIAASVHADYGHLLRRCNQLNKAREHLERALALDPNGAQGLRARELLKELGDTAPNGARA